MENSSYNLTWEDGTVIQTEEVITEEFIEEVNGEFEENIVNEDELIEEVGVIETEVIEDAEEIIEQQQEVSLEVEPEGSELVYLADDGNILVMNEHQYHEDQLMGVTEEIITDNWDTSCPEEIIIGSEEAISSSGTLTAADDDDIILPTDQDEYTAARPYPCDFCSRRFRKKVNLMNHMVAHQTDRPHGCNLCGVRYVRKADLMNHLKSHAYIPDPEQNELSDDDNALADQSFGDVKPPRRKNRAYGKRKKKRLVKVEYENLFTNDDAASSHANNFEEYPETEEIRYIEGEEEEDNKDFSTSQGATKYPVTDSRKPFVCQHCGVGFGREKALASHSRVHAGDSPFECQKCGEMFWDINLMQSHAREKHGEIQYDDDDEDDDYSESDETKYGTFYCSTCGLSFHRQDNLRRHQRIHIKEEFLNEQDIGHICNVCGESFPEALDLLAHAEVHARGSEHRCMLCGEICIDENTLAIHVQGEHKNLPPNTCALCGRTCKDNRSLLKHSWEHSKEKTFGCMKCSKTFHNKARLKRHMLSHRNKVVTCAVCGEDFPDGRSLMNHRHSHSSVSGRQFPCKDCGKTFGSRSSQQIHVRIHTGERPYGCRFCWKAFADGGTLRKHERIHTGEKPYACAVCPRAFNQRVVLREHIRSHHSGPDPKYAHSMTPYCCAVCSDMFATSQDLIVHLIHHCDLNTAMKRQPQVGPRKYKRRRKLKPHELDSMASTNSNNQSTNEIFTVNQEEIVVEELENNILEDEPPIRKKMRRTARKPSTSQKPSIISDSISDSIYNSLRTIENNEAVVIPKSPSSKPTKTGKKSKNESASSVGARPKMIHTQKTKVAVETGEDGKIKHKTRTLVTRTQPTVSSKTSGERVRPRTKNVSYHVLNPEKFPLATFAEESVKDPTQEAVDNLLKQTDQDIANGEVVTEEIVENAPYINPSEPVAVEAEAAVPTGLVRVRDRRTSSRNSKNVIGPGSKVRLVKEGMVVSKMKRNSESLNEPESILPDNPSSSSDHQVVVKLERVFEDHSDDEHAEQDAENVQIEAISVKEYNLIKHANIKQELLDPSALHELAEISMRHANADPLYKCEMCDEVFSDRAQLLIHVPIHI